LKENPYPGIRSAPPKLDVCGVAHSLRLGGVDKDIPYTEEGKRTSEHHSDGTLQ
jgi:hypothetical protein